MMGWMVRISLDGVDGRTSLDGVDGGTSLDGVGGGTSLDRVDVCGTRLDVVVGEIRLDGWMSQVHENEMCLCMCVVFAYVALSLWL